MNRSPKTVRRSALATLLPPRFYETAALTVLVAVFLLLTTADLGSPGRLMDSLWEEWNAANWARALRAEGQWPPLECRLYHGNLMSFVLFPLFYVFGCSWTFIRAWPIAWGAVTLVVLYFFLKNAFGALAALLGVLLLVVHAPFVMGIKVGNHQVSPMLIFSTGALGFSCLWADSGKVRYLFAAALLAGLGLGTRLWFVWFVLGLAAALAVVFREKWGPRPALAAGGGFALGAAPVWMTELAQGLPSFRKILQSYVDSTLNPSAYFAPDLSARVENFFQVFHRQMLQGDYFVQQFFFQGTSSSFNPWYPAVMWGSVLICAYAVFVRKPPYAKALAAVLVVFLVMAGLAFLSPADRAGQQFASKFFIFYPFPQILMALAVLELATLLRFRRGVRYVPAALLLLFAAQEVRALSAFRTRLAREGAPKADALYDLADWLRRRAEPDDPLLFLDGDMEINLRLLMSDRRLNSIDPVNFRNPEEYLPERRLYDRMLEGRRGEDILVIKPAGEDHRFEALKDWARREKVLLRPERLVRDRRDEEALYEVFSVRL